MRRDGRERKRKRCAHRTHTHTNRHDVLDATIQGRVENIRTHSIRDLIHQARRSSHVG